MAKILFDKFRGIWARGADEDCPPEFYLDSSNIKHYNYGIETRDGTTDYITQPSKILRSRIYRPNPPYVHPDIPRPIIMLETGTIHDPVKGVVVAPAGIYRDFTLVNMFGRAYISPSLGDKPIAGQSLIGYDGTASFVPGNSTLLASPIFSALGAGDLPAGNYGVYIAAENARGVIGPIQFIEIVSVPAGSSVNFTIPLGPAGTVARHIISTLPLPLTSSTTEIIAAPVFFISRIPNNVDLTYTLDFYENQVFESADHLKNLVTSIPAGIGITKYNGRLIIYGEEADPSLIRASSYGEPEVFNASSGFAITDPSDPSGIKNAIEYRGNLYVFGKNRTIVLTDNGSEISTWQQTVIDDSLGTDIQGIEQTLDSKGASSEGFLVANESGLLLFNGIYNKPELSFNIENLWRSINWKYSHLVEVTRDTVNKIIYITVPLHGDEVDTLLVADYRDGLNPNAIKWDKWGFSDGIDVNSVLIYTDFTSGEPEIVTRFVRGTKIVTLDSTVKNDSLVNHIGSWIVSAPARFSDGISHFNRMKLRVKGSGVLFIYNRPMDDVDYSIPSIQLNLGPGREYAQLMNVISEHCKFLIGTNVDIVTELGSHFQLVRFQVEGDAIWDERARV